MVAAAVLEAKLYVIEHELRCVSQFVRPRDQRIGNDDSGLPQQPLGDVRIIAFLFRIEFDARHMQAAVHVAADGKLRPVDREL